MMLIDNKFYFYNKDIFIGGGSLYRIFLSKASSLFYYSLLIIVRMYTAYYFLPMISQCWILKEENSASLGYNSIAHYWDRSVRIVRTVRSLVPPVKLAFC